MLGHTTVAITLNRYSHVTETMQLEAAQVMGAIISHAGDLGDEGSGKGHWDGPARSGDRDGNIDRR